MKIENIELPTGEIVVFIVNDDGTTLSMPKAIYDEQRALNEPAAKSK